MKTLKGPQQCKLTMVMKCTAKTANNDEHHSVSLRQREAGNKVQGYVRPRSGGDRQRLLKSNRRGVRGLPMGTDRASLDIIFGVPVHCGAPEVIFKQRKGP